MKKTVLLLLLINVFQDVPSQIIKGVILDNSDNSKISYASVYINGTSTGTSSDQNGQFELNITRYASLPLTISALGYYTVTLSDFSKTDPLEVYLTQKPFELNEVIVAAKSTARDRVANLKLFRDQFLGTSYNGHNCIIMNEGDISFSGSSHDTLKASASKPILVVNNSLGYTFTYYLDKFEYNRKTKVFLYKGSALFTEDMSEALPGKNFFEKRRKNAYLGSRNHFFTSLWTNSLGPNGFIVRNSIDDLIRYDDIVTMRAGFKKYLSSKENLYIYYMSKSPNSIIEILKDQIFFDSNGYFDGTGLNVTGQMAQQRIGDLLPYDYKVN